MRYAILWFSIILGLALSPLAFTQDTPQEKKDEPTPEKSVGPFKFGGGTPNLKLPDIPEPKPKTPPASKPATLPVDPPATSPTTIPVPPATKPIDETPATNPIATPVPPKGPRKLDPIGPASRTGPGSNVDIKRPPVELAKSLAEFPPGLFTDGNSYRLNDLPGKVIVLYFFDSFDDRVVATIPQRNALIKRFKDKPIVFFGVENDTLQQVRNSARRLNLSMPVFADTLGVMMSRYHVNLHTGAAWNVVIIDPRGKVSHEEMTELSLENALEGATWKYRDKQTWDPKVLPAVEALEMGDYERGVKIVSTLANAGDPRIRESARALLALLRAEADDLRSQAEAATAKSPLVAYDCYRKVMLSSAGTDVGRAAADALKKLENHREVRPEVQARSMIKILGAAVSRDEEVEKWDAVGYCEEIIRVCPGTPTADELIKYLQDLGKVKERGVYVPRSKRRN